MAVPSWHPSSAPLCAILRQVLLRRSLVLALSAASVALAAAAPSALALPDQASDTGAAHARRVCSVARAGDVACDALVRTRGDGVTPDASVKYSGGFRADQLRTAYGIPSISSSSTVAVVDAYANPNAASDLAAYRAEMGIARLGSGQFTQVNQAGLSIASVGADVGWGQEEMLDLEMVSAMCPSCNI